MKKLKCNCHSKKLTSGHPLQKGHDTKVNWPTDRPSQYSLILILINIKTNLDLRNTTLVYGFHFQHRNFRTFPIESLPHDSGRTLVCAEYGYPKGSPNTNS
jgi:hypothetical protein